MSCSWFDHHHLDIVDLYDQLQSHTMPIDVKAAWDAHRISCVDCQSDWESVHECLPLMRDSKEALAEEPSPFFFSRQLASISHALELRERSWLGRIMDTLAQWQAWKDALPKPVMGLALLVLMAVSWTVYDQSGGNMVAQLEGTQKAMTEILFNGDAVSLLSDLFLMGHGDMVSFLF